MHQTRIVIAALAITIGAAGTADAGRGPAVLASLPDDTTVLAQLDVKKLVAAPIAADWLDMAKAQAQQQLDQMKAAGIDFEKDVTKVFVALAGGSLMDADNARLKIVIAEGKLAIDAGAMKDPTKTYEGVTYWATTEADIAVIGKRVYVVSDGHMPDIIDVIQGKAKNAVKGPAAKKLRTAIGATTVTHAGWVVGVVSETERGTMGERGKDLSWFSASAALRKDAVDVAVRIGMTSATAAKTMVDETSAQIGDAQQAMSQFGLAGLAKSLSVAAKGATVSIGATATKDEIGTITGLLNMMGSMATSSAGTKGP